MRFVRLKTEKEKGFDSFFRIGSYVGFFKVYSIADNENIFRKDDLHLNFRVSILNSKRREYNIKVTILVEYNNRKGRIYMLLIEPFS